MFLRLPETGQYGVRIRGTREYGAVHEPMYDYVIDYRKIKTRPKKAMTIQQEVESLGPGTVFLYQNLPCFRPFCTDD